MFLAKMSMRRANSDLKASKLAVEDMRGIFNFPETYQVKRFTSDHFPSPGSYVGSQSVTISCSTPSSTIYYTTDGSTPTTNSPQYTGPVIVSSSETVKAIATASGFVNSAVGSAAYVITPIVAIGFAPNWYFGQQNAGLEIFVATGVINGVQVNGTAVPVPANSTTYVWVTAAGLIQTGLSVPSSAYGIAVVVSGTVVTGGNTEAGLAGPLGQWSGLTTDSGILSVTDIWQRQKDMRTDSCKVLVSLQNQ
jgi:hypothetical protein